MRALGHLACVLVAVVSGCRGSALPESSSSALAVIYGEDDRREASAVPAQRTAEDAVVALVSEEKVGGLSGFDEDSGTASEQPTTCAEERFGTQPRMARCTGFFIAPELLVTAGHCLPEDGSCTRDVFVSGFALTSVDGGLGPVYFSRCESLVAREVGVLSGGDTVDYALLRVVRAADLTRHQLSPGAVELEPGERVMTFGFPEGLPLKVDDNALVAGVSATNFRLRTDAYEGSSGSPVVVGDGHVVGLLVRGQQDYEWDADGGCWRSRVLTMDSGASELAMRLDVALERACRLFGVAAACGNADAPNGALAEAGVQPDVEPLVMKARVWPVSWPDAGTRPRPALMSRDGKVATVIAADDDMDASMEAVSWPRRPAKRRGTSGSCAAGGEPHGLGALAIAVFWAGRSGRRRRRS